MAIIASGGQNREIPFSRSWAIAGDPGLLRGQSAASSLLEKVLLNLRHIFLCLSWQL